ncbi:hypothetical protein FHS20_004274 [Phyllobacterium endophyticum]|nr:hypothetical protein [Phyllobacterium endophyticum]
MRTGAMELLFLIAVVVLGVGVVLAIYSGPRD